MAVSHRGALSAQHWREQELASLEQIVFDVTAGRVVPLDLFRRFLNTPLFQPYGMALNRMAILIGLPPGATYDESQRSVELAWSEYSGYYVFDGPREIHDERIDLFVRQFKRLLDPLYANMVGVVKSAAARLVSALHRARALTLGASTPEQIRAAQAAMADVRALALAFRPEDERQLDFTLQQGLRIVNSLREIALQLREFLSSVGMLHPIPPSSRPLELVHAAYAQALHNAPYPSALGARAPPASRRRRSHSAHRSTRASQKTKPLRTPSTRARSGPTTRRRTSK